MLRLLKLLSGLALFWVGRPARPMAQARSVPQSRSVGLNVEQKEHVAAWLTPSAVAAPIGDDAVEILFRDGGHSSIVPVRLGAYAGMALCRILHTPGSKGMGFGFDGNDGMLAVGWSHGGLHGGLHVEIKVWEGDEATASLELSPPQAHRLGDDVAKSLTVEEIKMGFERFGSIRTDERVMLSFLPGAWNTSEDRGADEVEICFGKGAGFVVARGLVSGASTRIGCKVNGSPGSIEVQWQNPLGDGQICEVDVRITDGGRMPLTLLAQQARHLGEILLRYTEA